MERLELSAHSGPHSYVFEAFVHCTPSKRGRGALFDAKERPQQRPPAVSVSHIQLRAAIEPSLA
jgi:hypothetical protein